MTTRYTRDHEWISLEGDTATVGISDYAQEQLGDIVFVELPAVGKKLDKGAEVAVVESVKAASEVYAPVAGEVVGRQRRARERAGLGQHRSGRRRLVHQDQGRQRRRRRGADGHRRLSGVSPDDLIDAASCMTPCPEMTLTMPRVTSAFGRHVGCVQGPHSAGPFQPTDGETTMNSDIIQGNWIQLKGKVQQQWAKLTGDDLDTIEGKRKELVGQVQERYGYAREQAEKEVDSFLKTHALATPPAPFRGRLIDSFTDRVLMARSVCVWRRACARLFLFLTPARTEG